MKIFGFVKKVFFVGLTILSSFTNVNSLSCISMNNQECKTRPQVVNVNSNNPIFYPFSIKTSKCSGNCNNINNPYAKICVPDVIKDLNVKVFNLMSRTNETRHIKWHETCKSKCRLDARVFVIINNVGIMINVNANVKSWLIKVYVIKDLIGILVIVNVNAINHTMLVFRLWKL